MKSFINFLPPWVETNIQPAFYDKESGSVIQQTARMYAKVNQLVRIANEQYETIQDYINRFIELKDYVEDYFTNLDVQEEIDKKLDEMAEDGTLGNIIASFCDNGYYNKSMHIGFRRKMREFVKSSNNPDYSPVNDYPSMQGGCYIGNNLFAQCSIRGGSDDKVLLRIINLTTGDTQRSVVLNMQHANSITYNPDDQVFYVTSLVLNGTNTHYIYVVDYLNLTITKTIDLSSQLDATEGTHSISYDQTNNKTYLMTEYRGTNQNKFYELDVENETITQIQLEDYHNLISNTGNNFGSNDICVDNGILYILKHIPSIIIKYNITTGKCIYVYACEKYISRGVNLGELESISKDPDSDDFYLSTTRLDCSDGWFYRYNYVITNFAHGVEDGEYTVSGFGGIYVDASSTSLNPTGTATNPYKTIGEALEVLNQKEMQGAEFYITAGTYPYIGIKYDKFIRLIKRGSEATSNYVIQGVGLENADVELNGLTINGTETYDVNANTSNVYITACIGSDALTNINLYKSTLKVFSFKKANTNFASIRSQAESIVNPFDDSPAYPLINVLPILGKDITIGTLSSITTSYVTSSYAGFEDVVEKSSSRLKIRLYKSSSEGLATITLNGRNTTYTYTTSCVIDSAVVTVAVKIDTTAKTIGVKINSAWQVTSATPSDISGSLTLSGYVYIGNRH